MATKIHVGYVITESGMILLSLPENHWYNKHGYELCDDDQSWPGGIGIASWEPIGDNDPRITPEIRERLQWILDGRRARDRAWEDAETSQQSAD